MCGGAGLIHGRCRALAETLEFDELSLEERDPLLQVPDLIRLPDSDLGCPGCVVFELFQPRSVVRHVGSENSLGGCRFFSTSTCKHVSRDAY